MNKVRCTQLLLVCLMAGTCLCCSRQGENNSAATQSQNSLNADATPSVKQDARRVLNDALALAKLEDKNVFVHLGAPWWGWCRTFEKFLEQSHEQLQKDYVVIKIDIEEMLHGADVESELRGDGGKSIPWMTIMDPDGNQLVNSDGPDGNIGCPISTAGSEYFLQMIDATARHSTEQDRLMIRGALAAMAKPYREKLGFP